MREKLNYINKKIDKKEYSEAYKETEKLLNNTKDLKLKSLLLEKKSYLLFKLGLLEEAMVATRKIKITSDNKTWLEKYQQYINIKEKRQNKVGRFLAYPDITNSRKLEGGLRTKGIIKSDNKEYPLVTIITVLYNNKDTLERCIESVKKQTYKNIEYIIIDGGSKDEVLNIIIKNKEYIDYYLSEPDKGIYNAMNKGIALSRGSYLALLNSDDFYDVDFITKSINALRKNALREITITNYFAGDDVLKALSINDGIYFGHLNICHNTFLVHKDIYEEVGLYSEDFKIVSDAVWIRKAYDLGIIFTPIDEALFNLTDGGLSSGNTEARRELFISEVVSSYLMNFPDLEKGDAENIYLFRFNKKRINEIQLIFEKYRKNKKLIDSLIQYVNFCTGHRKNFVFSQIESIDLLPNYINFIRKHGLNINELQVSTKKGMLKEVLKKIKTIEVSRKNNSKKTLLHVVSVFSAPSETFIYDLLTRLEKHTSYDNFILFDHEKLPESRPYPKKIHIQWDDFKAPVAKLIYDFILNCIKPDVILAHFAINEKKFYERFKFVNVIPTITMCHGVDVFLMKEDELYKKYILNDYMCRPASVFTAVSNYLKKEMISLGVDENKIHLIHNTVNPSFFANRKKSLFYDKKRDLRILCIGRLIKWKGHSFLFEALADFKNKISSNFKLSLVYGGGDDLLSQLTLMAKELGINNNMEFIPFIDFAGQPDYFSKFDLYIHPSTYSNDERKSSETFGVAVLEAIAAGLKVITTDAGGLPEVIGNEPSPHAMVVENGNSYSLFEALKKSFINIEGFSDNLGYATSRLNQYSETLQLDKISNLIESVSKPRIRLALFSTSTIQGAGYAAYRLHRGLQSTNIDSTLFTTVRNHENDKGVKVLSHPSGDNKQWDSLQQKPLEGNTISTINFQHIANQELLELTNNFDVVNLHWTARFLSIENIAALTHGSKPVIMTIRDMLPITGGCHFFHGCNQWKNTCADCPQIYGEYVNSPEKNLKYKKDSYNFKNLTLVAISQHTKNIILKSPIFGKCRIEVIPNSIELDVFRPYDIGARRKELGLPLDRLIVGYVPSFSSTVKGYNELIKALKLIEINYPNLNPFILLIGNNTPATDSITLDKKSLGYISDNKRLAWAYSACDLIVVPSLEETFSNTTAEAIACGVPVVGFKTGAIPDLVINGKTGYCLEVGDVDGFAESIVKVLTGKKMRGDCHRHAESYLPFLKQAKSYEALVEELCSKK